MVRVRVLFAVASAGVVASLLLVRRLRLPMQMVALIYLNLAGSKGLRAPCTVKSTLHYFFPEKKEKNVCDRSVHVWVGIVVDSGLVKSSLTGLSVRHLTLDNPDPQSASLANLPSIQASIELLPMTR